MRIKYAPLITLFVLLIVAFLPQASAQSGLLAGRTIVLDPGHGGEQAGACYFGVREADVNLAIGRELAARLTAAGANVVMTRTTDELVACAGTDPADELQARVDIAQAAGADIFVSLHANAHPAKPETAGVITFRAPGRSTALAAAIQEAVVEETGAVDKGVRTANFYVLRHSDRPAVLVEAGFLSNRVEAARLNTPAYQKEVASGIYKGIVRYFLALNP